MKSYVSIRWVCPQCKSKLYNVEYNDNELVVICAACKYKEVVMKITQDSITRLKL